MNITEVKVFKIEKRGVLLGYANIILNNSFIIRGIKLLENERLGRFIAMPSRMLRDEKRATRDICHPINQETRTELTDLIFEAFDSLEEE